MARAMRIHLLLAYVVVFSCPFLAAQRWHAATKDQLSQQASLPLEDMAHMSWVRLADAYRPVVSGVR